MFKKIKMSLLAIAAIAILASPLSVSASEVVTVEGLYRHPLEGNIEDSGGESSEALGQSMVTKMVAETATYDDANKNLDVTFYMMNSISDLDIQVQFTGTDMFTSVDFYQLEKGDDEACFRVPVTVKSDILRIEAFVEPMGRAVVFYVVIEGALEGVDFDTLPSGNKIAESSSAGLVIGGPDVDGEDLSEEVLSGVGIDSSMIIYAFLFLCSVLITSGAVLILFTVVLFQIIADRKALKQLANERKEQVFEKKETSIEQEEVNTEQIIALLKEGETDEQEKN